MHKSIDRLKCFIGLFALVAIVSCGGNGGGGTAGTAILGSLTLSGSDTSHSGTILSPNSSSSLEAPAIDKLLVSWLGASVDGNQGWALQTTFGLSTGKLLSNNFAWTSRPTSSGVFTKGNYWCAPPACVANLSHDPSAKTVTFNNVELPVVSGADNNATGPMTLNGTLKYQ